MIFLSSFRDLNHFMIKPNMFDFSPKNTRLIFLLDFNLYKVYILKKELVLQKFDTFYLLSLLQKFDKLTTWNLNNILNGKV